jgi:hypothetical protein
MNDDELLKALGDAARGMERDDAEPHADELARPLDDVARARMHAHALRAMGVGVVEPAAPRSASRPVWRRSAIALPLAAAAALVLFVSHRREAPMPAYDLIVATEDVADRGAAPATSSATVTGDHLVLVARPATPVERAAAHVFAAHDGVTHELTPSITISTEGAVRIDGSVRALFTPPEGTWDVVVAVGRADAPAPTPAQAVAPELDVPGWTRARTTLTLKPAR